MHVQQCRSDSLPHNSILLQFPSDSFSNRMKCVVSSNQGSQIWTRLRSFPAAVSRLGDNVAAVRLVDQILDCSNLYKMSPNAHKKKGVSRRQCLSMFFCVCGYARKIIASQCSLQHYCLLLFSTKTRLNFQNTHKHTRTHTHTHTGWSGNGFVLRLTSWCLESD